ncbi:MAG: tetraacyldisaccharide 4'-kinase [Kiritimatiellae bacterium]|nr:tetraacyldisaccharide 4'-kinase [Kiritimatiellia bacterium]
MHRARPKRLERFERFLLRLIQHPGADQGHTRGIRLLLGFLEHLSLLFRGVVQSRLWLFDAGILSRFPLGCQVISVGNVTVGGTGKTPVVEIFARELTAAGRKVAILSRGYRKKELPLYQRLLLWGKFVPPRVVSDGQRVLLDSEMSGDEPYMLASNLPGVVVLVDKDRVKSGRYAIRRFGCDMLILDDGFQYQRLKHRHEVVLVDRTNPFGNGHMLPRGILREPARNIKRADFLFITKSDGHTEELREELRLLNPTAEIVACRHQPRFFKDAFSGERLDLGQLQGLRVVVLSGIAAPLSFETSMRAMGARVLTCERFTDHHRYTQQEILDVINRADELGAQAIVTTEKDAVRLPRMTNPKVPIYYLRMEIQIMQGYESFKDCVARICFRTTANAESPS